jgi:2-dehydropantoate 2-reductase
MKIAILGAGSLGSAFGGLLALAGHEVVLINRNPDFCAQVNINGLTLNEGGVGGMSKTVHLKAIPHASVVPSLSHPFDLIMVLVKSKDTEAVVRSALHWLSEHTVVMSLQNGLGHEDLIGTIVGKARVIAGKTYVGGLMTALGVVTIGIKNKETIIGELDGKITPRVSAIGKAFSDAGLLTTVSSNIMGAMWDKILVNVATGAITGITRLVYGLMYQVPELETTACAAVSEAMTVATAKGIELSITEPKVAWERAGKGLPFEFKASMLQTLEKNSVTEIDYINGAVVQEGKRFGIATPVNETLVACIKGIEAGIAARDAAQPHPTEKKKDK